MDFNGLLGRSLKAVWLSRFQVHPAWVDASSPNIATCIVNLEFTNLPATQVSPCEVPVLNRFPALGIELGDWSGSPEIQRWPDGSEFALHQLAEAASYLPASISSVRLWDSLGEGPVSAVDLVLSTGLMLTIRHIYPPMTLGIDFRPHANEL
jgi:hypothetical protein